jgi:6-phosphogluconolactonase
MSPERFHLGGAEILVGEDLDEAIQIATGQFVALARYRAAAGRELYVALSGGKAPQPMFRKLVQEPFVSLVPWKHIHFFWGDERNVPPGDPESNYSMANDLLFSHVAVPRSSIHRIPAGDGTAVEAADLYEKTLRAIVPQANGRPRFDLVMLGVGTNGHTASLFPHRPTLHETERLVVADHVDEVNGWRVSLTLPVLNNAAQITFLATGGEKAEVAKKVIEGSRDPESTPAQLIAPSEGNLTWILDAAAARELHRSASGTV